MPVDEGTHQLRSKKRRATGAVNLEANGAGVLYGRNLIDAQQYDVLGRITGLLQRVARAWGGKDGSVGGLWAALLGASTATGRTVAVPAGSDNARYQLARILQRLDGSRDLIVSLAEGRLPSLIIHVVENHLTRQDENDLIRLRTGLDSLAGGRRVMR